MKLLLTIVITILLFQFECIGVKADTDSLKNYIFDFLKTRPVADVERAISYVPIVEKYSAVHNFDPHLIAFIISLESSWNYGAESKDKKDFGLMGIRKNGVCGRGQDLSTPEGQIRAGVECLALSRDTCNGKLKQTLTMYASGKCKSESKRTQRKMRWRVLKYRRILQEYTAKK